MQPPPRSIVMHHDSVAARISRSKPPRSRPTRQTVPRCCRPRHSRRLTSSGSPSSVPLLGHTDELCADPTFEIARPELLFQRDSCNCHALGEASRTPKFEFVAKRCPQRGPPYRPGGEDARLLASSRRVIRRSASRSGRRYESSAATQRCRGAMVLAVEAPRINFAPCIGTTPSCRSVPARTCPRRAISAGDVIRSTAPSVGT